MTEVPHKFIQIAASEHLYALDQNGDVWEYAREGRGLEVEAPQWGARSGLGKAAF